MPGGVRSRFPRTARRRERARVKASGLLIKLGSSPEISSFDQLTRNPCLSMIRFETNAATTQDAQTPSRRQTEREMPCMHRAAGAGHRERRDSGQRPRRRRRPSSPRTKSFQKHRNAAGKGVLWLASDNLLCDGGGTAGGEERREEASEGRRRASAGHSLT